MRKLAAILLAVIAACIGGVVLLDLATFNSDYPLFNRNIGDPDPNGMTLLTVVLPLLLLAAFLWFAGKRQRS